MEQLNQAPFEPMQFLNGKPVIESMVMTVYWQEVAKIKDISIRLQPNWQWGFLTFIAVPIKLG